MCQCEQRHGIPVSCISSFPLKENPYDKACGWGVLLSSQEISTCDQHGYLTMKSQRPTKIQWPKATLQGSLLHWKCGEVSKATGKRAVNSSFKVKDKRPGKYKWDDWRERNQILKSLSIFKVFFHTRGGEGEMLESLHQFFITFLSNSFCFSFQLEKKTEVPPNCHPHLHICSFCAPKQNSSLLSKVGKYNSERKMCFVLNCWFQLKKPQFPNQPAFLPGKWQLLYLSSRLLVNKDSYLHLVTQKNFQGNKKPQ